MKITYTDGKTQITLDEEDDKVVWQIVAARIRANAAGTLRDEYIKAVEEVVRIARQLREEPVQRRRPNGEVWTFRADGTGAVIVEVEGGTEG